VRSVERTARLWHTQVVPKRPRDPNQLAKLVLDIATGEIEDTVSESKRQPSTKGRANDVFRFLALTFVAMLPLLFLMRKPNLDAQA
jgi:hypothetical protein